MFRASLVFHREHFQNKLLQLPYMILLIMVHIEEFPAVLLHEGNENVKQLFYTIVCSLILDHKARNM